MRVRICYGRQAARHGSLRLGMWLGDRMGDRPISTIMSFPKGHDNPPTRALAGIGSPFPRPFQQHVLVHPEHGTIEIILEDVSCHHEWIHGEGANISIHRAMGDNRVVGATLPLRNWKGYLPVDIL